MKDSKEVMEDPIKSKIMSFSCYRDKVAISEFGEEIGAQGGELKKVLNSLGLTAK